jgi:hypothetical protein
MRELCQTQCGKNKKNTGTWNGTSTSYESDSILIYLEQYHAYPLSQKITT